MDSVESSELSQIKKYTSFHSSSVSESICLVAKEEEASVQCEEKMQSQSSSKDIWEEKAASILERRSAKSHMRNSLAKLRPSASLDEYSPPPSASFTIHRPSWIAMEDIEIGATIRRKKKARKSLSREISVDATVVIQEEPLVYTLNEELDENSNRLINTHQIEFDKTQNEQNEKV